MIDDTVTVDGRAEPKCLEVCEISLELTKVAFAPGVVEDEADDEVVIDGAPNLPELASLARVVSGTSET